MKLFALAVVVFSWIAAYEIDKLRDRVTVLEAHAAFSTPHPAVEPIYFRF